VDGATRDVGKLVLAGLQNVGVGPAEGKGDFDTD
jgi:hypothetical protein